MKNQPSSFVNRAKTAFGGFFFTGLSLVFIVVGIGMVATSVHRAVTYLPAPATVDFVKGNDETSDKVSVTYSYTVNGVPYSGTEDADDDNKTKFNELRRFSAGQQLTVYYNPRKPEQSQRSNDIDATGLAFAIFALPFFAIGFNQLWLGLTGKEIVRSRQPNPQSDSVPGGSLFLIFVAACVICTIGHLVISSLLPSPWCLLSGLLIVGVVLPGTTYWSIRAIKRWQFSQAVENRHSRAAQRELESSATAKDADSFANAAFARSVVGSLGKKLAIALFFALFWCGLTGAFTYFAVGSLYKHYYARLHFLPVNGEILSSEIKVSSGDEGGSLYAPKIKYRYSVGEKCYVGDQYDFLGGSSSDDSYARKAVGENPTGKMVAVYYNPDKPDEAILQREAPASSYFILLFLQPFQLIGLKLIAWCATLPFSHYRAKRFLECGETPPWNIPGWGKMEQGMEGFVLRERRSWLAPFGYFLAGYGMTCFLSIFVVGFFFHGFGDANIDAIRWAFLLAACVGGAALIYGLFSTFRVKRMIVDPMKKRFAVYGGRRDIDAPFEQIKHLQLRNIYYPGNMSVNNERIKNVQLEAVHESGEAFPLHAFSWQAGRQEEDLAVAMKAQYLLAHLIGCDVADDIVDDGLD